VAKQEILVKQVSEGLKMELENSRVSLKTHTDQYYVDRKNLELSVKIYNKTYVKYTEGISSSMDLNQAYLQVLTEEGDYISTIFQLLNNYIKISKILNNL
jgi:outer membrane protein TolC